MEINKACSTPEGRQAPTPDGTWGDRRDLRLRGTRRTQKGASPAIPRCPASELERLIRAESPGDAAGVAPVQTGVQASSCQGPGCRAHGSCRVPGTGCQGGRRASPRGRVSRVPRGSAPADSKVAGPVRRVLLPQLEINQQRFCLRTAGGALVVTERPVCPPDGSPPVWPRAAERQTLPTWEPGDGAHGLPVLFLTRFP